MGLGCKVIEHKGNIEVVESPNGEKSILYKNALELTQNQFKALDLWSIPYTLDFIGKKGDWANNGSTLELDKNGEPLLKDVLKYVDSIRYKGQQLTNEELSQLANNMYSMPVNTFDDFYQHIRGVFYSKGYFLIEEKKLAQSGIYSEMEIDNIMSNPQLQENIKGLLTKIGIEYHSDRGGKFDELIETSFFEEGNLLYDTNEVVGIGKYKALNPLEITKEISKIVGGIKNRDEFDKRVEWLPYENIINRYYSDQEFANEFFDQYSSLKGIPEFAIEEGILQPKVNNNTYITLKETLKIGEDASILNTNTLFLSTIPGEIWVMEKEDITSELKAIEESLIAFNIDVIGLSDSYETSTQGEILEALNELIYFTDKLNTNTLKEGDIQGIAEVIDRILDRQVENSTSYQEVNNRDVNKTLIKMNTLQNDMELFENHSLLKVDGDIYQKIEVEESIIDTYNVLYSIIQINPNILPKEAYYPYGFNSRGEFDRSKLNEENRDLILQGISRFVQNKGKEINNFGSENSNGVIEKMVLYKYIFDNPLTYNTGISVEQEYTKYKNFTGDINYLTTDFIADFNTFILQNKFKDNKLYKEVLRHFEISENGINMVNTDIHTKQQINLLASGNKMLEALKQYTFISKNKNLENLFSLKEEKGTITNDFKRALYMNNPNLLKSKKIDYKIVEDKLVTNHVTSEFIRTDLGVFELVKVVSGISIYQEIPVVEDKQYNNYEIEYKVDYNIDTKPFLEVVENTIAISTQHTYSKNELKKVKEEIDECL